MANEKQRKTFLSYSRLNKDFAIKLAKELKSEGFDVWLDTLDIPLGSRWDREVERALKESEIFMIILTPNSVDSENVLDEIGYAIDTHKQILPILLEECEMPLRLRRLQYVDFTKKSFDEGLKAAKALLLGLSIQATKDMADQSTVEEVEQKMYDRPQLIPSITTQKKPLSRGFVIVISGILLGLVGLSFVWVFQRIRTNSPFFEDTSGIQVFEFDDLGQIVSERGSPCSNGRQNMLGYGVGQWREDDHLFGAGVKNCELIFELKVKNTGKYKLDLYATYAPDFGILNLALARGEQYDLIRPIDLYRDSVESTGPISLGNWDIDYLSDNRLIITVTDKNLNSSNYKFGLDYLNAECVSGC